MSVIDAVEWSNTDYTMKDFVEKFQHRLPVLPVLCLTTSGFAGCDEDVHQIGACEVYWVYDIQQQKRMVAVDGQNRFLSIPVDYPIKVIIFSDDKLHTPVSGEAIWFRDYVSLLQGSEGDFSKHPIMFENNQKVSLQAGAESRSSAVVGTIHVIDTYEEKYLLAYPIFKGEVHPKTIGIPVYLNITMDTAVGIKGADQEQFQKWMDEITCITASYFTTPVKICKEIIVFDEKPTADNYEYIKPSKYLSGSGVCSALSESKRSALDNDYSYVTLPVRKLPPKSRSKSVDKLDEGISDKNNNNNNRYIYPIQKSEATLLPPFPTKSQKQQEKIIKAVRPPDVPALDGFSNVETKGHSQANPNLRGKKLCLQNRSASISTKNEWVQSPEAVQPPEVPARNPKTKVTSSDFKIKNLMLQKSKSSDNFLSESVSEPPRTPTRKTDAFMGAPMRAPMGEMMGPSMVAPVGERSSQGMNFERSRNCERPAVQTKSIKPTSKSQTRSSSRADPKPGKVKSPPSVPVVNIPSPLTNPNNVPARQQPSLSPAMPSPSSTAGHRSFAGFSNKPFTSYKSITEVPVNMDFKYLTSSEVLHCLKLLKLDAYSKSFQEQDVDGILLLNLDEQVLTEEFGFKRFESRKLLLFLNTGWRPK